MEKIIQTPQTYDGEHIDGLVALGSSAAPAIGEVLSNGAEFPFDLIFALEKIGDSRGAKPILVFIGGRTPFSSADNSSATARAIEALRSVPSTDSCAPLAEIMRNASSHPEVRLAAAGTLARICRGSVRDEAADLVLSYYERRSDYLHDPYGGFTEAQLYPALAQLRNDEASDILLAVLTSTYSSQILLPVIEFAERQEDGRFSNALLMVLENTALGPEVRLAAARALLNRADLPDDILANSIQEFRTEAETYGYPSKIIDEARRLSQ